MDAMTLLPIGDTPIKSIDNSIEAQHRFFHSRQTGDISFRLQQLKRLRKAILEHEEAIYAALLADLGKSREETYLTEISVVLSEIRYHLKNLKKWNSIYRVSTPRHLWPSSSRYVYQPLGTVLIIAPWNYPFQLILNPLVGALSSGCCAVLKPSPEAPNTALVVEKIMHSTFDRGHVTVIQGGIEVNTYLLEKRWDLIFFTGSTRVGKIIAEKAAKKLTPVILELGGKSPCVVDSTADLSIAAQRIAWGKILNAGQTCIAPDYILVNKGIQSDFVAQIIKHLENILGPDMQQSPHYGRIIHKRAMERLIAIRERTTGRIAYGGDYDMDNLYFSPTILTEVTETDSTMEEEIFGPLLPIITFDTLAEAITSIQRREKPLALYYFGDKKGAAQILSQTSSGGVSINDTILHIANHHLPFGGVGHSGMGSYHGFSSFQAFSHQKSILRSPTWIDLPFRYPPYRFFHFIKKLL